MKTGKWVLALSLVCAALAALAPGATAAPSVAGAATPAQAVSALLKPFYTPGPAGGACNALSGQVAGCPITLRLRYRLQHYQRGENGNLICRCQNPPRIVRWTQKDNNGFVAHVTTTWIYGASSTYALVFIVARQDDGWRVDDSACAGRPATSVYTPPTGPC